MRKPHLIVGVLSSALLGAAAAGALEREMSVMQGPETVFDRPTAEILPALAGAKLTGQNGRVGNELVFWGYEQANGQDVFFFACAQVGVVQCPERVQAVCPANTVVLETQQATGKIVRRNCSAVAVAGPGEIRPGCDDDVTSADLLVGLVSCG
jgi:hypothetical protein